ncbi:MAG TPA: hypothetical protein VF088_07160 [Pyrinomonadaceae bacterium]
MTPNPVTIVKTVAVISSSIVEKPLWERDVFCLLNLLFCIRVMVQKEVCGPSLMTMAGP